MTAPQPRPDSTTASWTVGQRVMAARDITGQMLSPTVGTEFHVRIHKGDYGIVKYIFDPSHRFDLRVDFDDSWTWDVKADWLTPVPSSPADTASETTISDVLAHAARYNGYWFDRSEDYWLMRLMQEVGELASVMAGDHDDTMEHELTQIASIAINWRRMRDEKTAVSPVAPAAVVVDRAVDAEMDGLRLDRLWGGNS